MRTESLRRELAVCAGILIAGALITVALFAVVLTFFNDDHDGAAPAATKPPCAAEVDVVTVWNDDPTPCDLNSQRLDVVGITIQVCDDMGGEWIGDGIDICSDVDT